LLNGGDPWHHSTIKAEEGSHVVVSRPNSRLEALGLAEQVGVAGAAKQLGLHESQLYAWRKKARYEASRSETEKELAIENARLKRQLAKQAEEIEILKKAARTLRKA
jgi:transposase